MAVSALGWGALVLASLGCVKPAWARDHFNDEPIHVEARFGSATRVGLLGAVLEYNAVRARLGSPLHESPHVPHDAGSRQGPDLARLAFEYDGQPEPCPSTRQGWMSSLFVQSLALGYAF